VTNGLVTTATDIPKQDLTNFSAIPFAADSTHMKGLISTGNDGTWITNGIVQISSFHAAKGTVTTCLNIWTPRYIVFSSVCDWNLRLTDDNHPYNGMCYAINVVFSI
jgi:hypothetical protein